MAYNWSPSQLATGDKKIMATKSKTFARFDVNTFAATVGAKVSESIGDMIVTVAVTGIALAYMGQTVRPDVLEMISGYYIAGMLVQLFIRIVHSFDDSYTADEVGKQLQRFEDDLNSRLDRIIESMIP